MVTVGDTPEGSGGTTITNVGTRQRVYAVEANAPLFLNGNFALFVGLVPESDGTVDEIDALGNFLYPITLNYTGDTSDSGPTQTVLDGNVEAPGANYTIGGQGDLVLVNQTTGLTVTINGYGSEDEALIDLPGGSVDADLTETGLGAIYVDGTARTTGTNPAAANNITAHVRAGEMSLNAVSTNDSVLTDYDTFYILASMPQDSLSVLAPTTYKVAPRAVGNSETSWDTDGAQGSFTPVSVVNPPAVFYSVLSTSFIPHEGRAGEPAILTTASFPGEPEVDSSITTLSVVGPGVNGTATVRLFPANANPLATDNDADLDASQLRGSFSFQVTDPDYATASLLMAAFGQWSGDPQVTFGQTHVNLSKVNPQLTVSVAGANPIPQATYAGFALDTVHYTVDSGVLNLPAAELTIGGGVLANIQGNVTLHNLALKEVDDRHGTDANILRLTGTSLTGWATAPGVAQPALNFTSLTGDLTIDGSPYDQFAVEGTPSSATSTTIRNFGPSTDGETMPSETPGVYLMAKTVMPLYVTGNFDLYVGRRLNSDGSVTSVGQVDGAFDPTNEFVASGAVLNRTLFNSGLFVNNLQKESIDTAVVPGITYRTYTTANSFQTPLPVFYDYTGPGSGTLVFDASQDSVVTSGDQMFNGVAPNQLYPGLAELRSLTNDSVVYSARKSSTTARRSMAPRPMC